MKFTEKLTALLLSLALLFAMAIPVTVLAKEVEIVYGDVDLNGDITAADALLALQCSVGKISLDSVPMEAARVKAADSVTAADALMILQAAVGKVSPESFPSGKSAVVDIADSSSGGSSSQNPSSGGSSETGKPSETLTPLSANDYWSYNQLNAVQKQIYEKIADGISQRSVDEIPVGTSDEISSTDIRLAYYAVQKDSPEFFYMPLAYTIVSTGNRYAVSMVSAAGSDNYIYSAEQTKKISAELGSQVDSIIDSVLTAGMSEYEMALALHDWIANNTTYHSAAAANPGRYPEAWSAANVLIGEKSGVCEGLARAYQMLLYRCGINNTLVSGTANGEGHMWNLVKLDGKWYETDVTWDDTNKEGKPAYYFFNQTTAAFAPSHTRADNIDDINDMIHADAFNYNLPAADSTELNYYRLNGLYFESTSDFADKAPQLIADAAAKGLTGVQVMIKGVYPEGNSDAGQYVTMDIILSANRLITDSDKKLKGYGTSVIRNAPAFLVVWTLG